MSDRLGPTDLEMEARKAEWRDATTQKPPGVARLCSIKNSNGEFGGYYIPKTGINSLREEDYACGKLWIPLAPLVVPPEQKDSLSITLGEWKAILWHNTALALDRCLILSNLRELVSRSEGEFQISFYEFSLERGIKIEKNIRCKDEVAPLGDLSVEASIDGFSRRLFGKTRLSMEPLWLIKDQPPLVSRI
jgi:hypothetical protein